MKKIQTGFSAPKEYHHCTYHLEFTDSHKPLSIYTSMFDKQGDFYYIFAFHNSMVAEFPQNGNAAFVLERTTGWHSFFIKSRQELRKNYKDWVEWIRHPTTWE